MINSKLKGKHGELEFSKVCHAEGYDNVHRTAQVRGDTGKCADCEGLEGIHIEVKRNEHLNIYDAIDQAYRDNESGGGKNIPIVAHRKNNKEWLVTMKVHEWFALYREWSKQ